MNNVYLFLFRHFQSFHRCLDGGNAERALFLGMTTDSETSDDAMRLVDRMKQLARCPPVNEFKKIHLSKWKSINSIYIQFILKQCVFLIFFYYLFQPPVIPSQNLRQLMPATNLPVAKVTKEKNKLIIVQQNKKHWYLYIILFVVINSIFIYISMKYIKLFIELAM